MTLCSSYGLATVIGHITSYVYGSLISALCVRTMRFLHLTDRLPHQGLPCSSVPLSQRTYAERQSAKLPDGKTRSRCFGFCWRGAAT